MKKLLSIIIILCAATLFVACDKTETFDNRWRVDNEAQFARISENTAYTKINSASTAGYIMYKKIESGDGETPTFSSRVKVLYTGWFKSDWSLPDTYKDNRGKTIFNKRVFDSTDNRNHIPSTFPVNPKAPGGGIIDGFSTALQHMKVGDKWEIWIPWNLGYGATANSGGSIPAYTTLVFEVELVDIVQ